MTSISLPGTSGSCFVRSVLTCWACVAVANPKVKINTERISFFMLCIASVLSVMCCDNRLNRSCVANTHSAANPLDRREEEVTRWTKRSVLFGGHTQDPPSSKVELSSPGPSISIRWRGTKIKRDLLATSFQYSFLVYCSVEKLMHQRPNSIHFFFQREMARIEKMEFCAGNISFQEFSTLHREDSIVFAPRDQRRGLMFAEVLLPIAENIQISLRIVED